MMMIMMMMKTSRANKCHKHVPLIRFMKDGDGSPDDEEDI